MTSWLNRSNILATAWTCHYIQITSHTNTHTHTTHFLNVNILEL